jgi:hypothetical protein
MRQGENWAVIGINVAATDRGNFALAAIAFAK